MRWATLETQYESDGVTYDVTYRYHPGFPGRMYARNGDPGDPPEPPEVEVVSAEPEGLNLDSDDLMEHCLRDAADQGW